MVTATARIKTVERDVVFFVSIEWPTISQSDRNDSTVITASLRFQFEAKQIALSWLVNTSSMTVFISSDESCAVTMKFS